MGNAILFFLIAILYASVGFGGGSGYIAILSFTDLPPSQLRFIALCCNVVVVSGGTAVFIRHKLLNVKKALPLVISSVPLAFLGGSIELPHESFFILLASCLLVSGLLMIKQPHNTSNPKSSSVALNLVIGGIIGFVSGLVGIGGGIFLAPLLYLIKWDSARVIAATSSFFILVNSLAGLAGQSYAGSIMIEWSVLVPPLLAVGVGGLIGSRVNINILTQIRVKRLTAVLVIFASLRIFYRLLI